MKPIKEELYPIKLEYLIYKQSNLNYGYYMWEAGEHLYLNDLYDCVEEYIKRD